MSDASFTAVPLVALDSRRATFEGAGGTFSFDAETWVQMGRPVKLNINLEGFVPK